jgi:hypothetical protein
MKKNLAIVFFAGHLLLASGTGREAQEGLTPEQENALRNRLTQLAVEWRPASNPGKAVFEFSAENGISTNALLHAVQKMSAAASSYAEKDTADAACFQSNRVFAIATDVFRIASDKSVLPFLESKTGSSSRSIKHRATIAYLSILGIGDTDKFRLLVSDGSLADWEKRNLYAVFCSCIVRAKKADPHVALDTAYAALLETMGKENTLPVAVDDMMCQTIEDYPRSIQRENNLIRALKNKPHDKLPPWAAETEIPEKKRIDFHGLKVDPHELLPAELEAIRKIPKAERKDFRAKGELLDPERPGRKNQPQ